MPGSRVLRLPVGSNEDEFVLLHVSPKGRKPLDLSLVATEGSGRYVGTLKHDRVSSLRVKNCPASESEWQSILESVLDLESPADIHTTAVVQSDSSVSITVRKQIQGITQRLGAISLEYDMSEDIQLFDWCGLAAQAAEDSRAAVASSSSQTRKLEKSVDDLQTQLDELVRVKDEDETTLLQKFRDLLNEKKVKIREQQKILASTPAVSGTQPGASQTISQPSSQQQQKGRVPAPSRSLKRKAASQVKLESEDDEDAGAQNMDVDKSKEEEPEDTDPGNTTDGTASTADEEDEEMENNEALPTDDPPEKNSWQPAGSKKQAQAMPPQRALPFNNKKSTPAAPAHSAADGGSETESDDEL